jgi:hypothetical protein
MLERKAKKPRTGVRQVFVVTRPAVAAAATAAATTPLVATASTTMVGRKQVIHVTDVDRAKKALQAIHDDPPANAPIVDEDGDASWGPVVLCEATTWKDFDRWLNRNEGRVRRWVFEPLEDGTGRGRVVIYSLPLLVHVKTSGTYGPCWHCGIYL